MEKYRLPKTQTEKPALFGAVTDNNEVKWCLNSDEMQDGTNWYQVWNENGLIHVIATSWFHSQGHFSICLTDETPDHCVQLASYTAGMIIQAHEGEFE